MGQESRDLFVEQVDQDENVGRDAGFTQGQRFFHGRHRQPGNALLHQRPGGFDRPVTVGVGLDDGHHAGAGRETFLDAREIMAECGEIDGGVGRVQGQQADEKVRQRCSRIAQRLNVRYKVRIASLLAAAALDGHFDQPAPDTDFLGDGWWSCLERTVNRWDAAIRLREFPALFS
jgi:hypothetical protein